MKPGFALSLSFEGISLLQRAAGGWRSVGEVPLDSDDLAAGLAGLRDKAYALESGELRCKVIIPNDQVRYLSLDTGSFDGETRLAMVHQALDDATPYPPEDLAYDISLDGATTHVAAVARDTLAEAETFAVDHGFNPLGFVAAPGENPFLGEPYFGPSTHAATLPDATEVEPDGIAVVVIGPVEQPNRDRQPDPEPESGSEPEPEPETGPALAGFASRRAQAKAGKAAAAEPADQAPEPEALAEPPFAAAAVGGAVPPAPDLPEPDLPDPDLPDPDLPDPVAFKSSVAASLDPDPDQGFAPEPVSVTAPSLDIPDFAESGAESGAEPEAESGGRAGLGGFLSRRKAARREGRQQPAPPAPPLPRAPTPVIHPASDSMLDISALGGPGLTAVSRPVGQTFVGATAIAPPRDETARMTVFGARGQAEVGGKPQHLGLILAAVLLLFLAAVAAWASIFLEDGVAGLFPATPPKTELAAAPGTPGIGVKAEEPGQPTIEDSDNPAQTPAAPAIQAANPADVTEETLALLPPPTSVELSAPRVIDQPVQPVSPDLSDTDSAVLDALGQPDQPDQPTPVTPDTDAAPPGQGTTQAVRGVATAALHIAPREPDTPTIIALDDLYVASIDRTDHSQDAVALPPVRSLSTDLPLGSVSSPVAAGTAFDLGPRGLVQATVGGTLNPDGVLVFLGRPPVVPPRVPTRFETQPETDIENDRLALLRPHPRPGDLEERFERNNLGGLTRDELSGLRPRARPESHQQEQAEPDQPPTAQAVVSSRLPRARPGNFAAIVSAAVRPSASDTSGGGQQVTTVAPRTVTPKIPSSASVARQATLRNEINLRRVNLIGVYGTPSNRRALVRLPSGRYKKVKVGDSVDGGRVVAIGDSELRYQKGGRNLTLKIPSS